MGLHFLVVGSLDSLLVSNSTYLSLPSSSKAEIDGVLVPINFPCAEYEHADVDRDDDLHSISELQWSLTRGDALGSPIRPQHPRKFLHPLAFRFNKTLTQAVEDSVVTDLGMAIALWNVGVEDRRVILYLEQKLATCMLAKLVPLSEMME